MNILFLTLAEFESLSDSNLYTDLLRQFTAGGHTVYAVSPTERRKWQQTHVVSEDGCKILRLRTGNIQKTNIIEKGITTLSIEQAYINGINRYFSGVKFDLILYSTPPITFCRAVEYFKKRDSAVSYLLLKDIFPQNAVDIGMMSTTGAKGALYSYFRRKEKRLYRISDHIGCMSPANVEYLLRHNSDISPDKVEVCPNCIEVLDKSISSAEADRIRDKYGIPKDRTAFVYGGNLGKPQGIPFMLEAMKSCSDLPGAYFIIVGDGTEYGLIEEYVQSGVQDNITLFRRLPKDDYDLLVSACDVGMIFLDHRFTIPNFPSRLLGYMQAHLPVLACTDTATDIGKVITEGGFGWWCESDSAGSFRALVADILSAGTKAGIIKMKENSFGYLEHNYNCRDAYLTIMQSAYRQ